MNKNESSYKASHEDKQRFEKLAYRLREAQSITGLSRSTIYNLIAQKKLQNVKVGGCRLILADDIRKLLAGDV